MEAARGMTRCLLASDAATSFFNFDKTFTKYCDTIIKYVSKMHTFRDLNFNGQVFFSVLY